MGQNINHLHTQANKAGFETYGSFNEGRLQHDILTCTNGKYDGEVIDIYYDPSNGSVSKVSHSAQFKSQEAKFKFV